jgi:hypothetical protein
MDRIMIIKSKGAVPKRPSRATIKLQIAKAIVGINTIGNAYIMPIIGIAAIPKTIVKVTRKGK